MFHSVPRFFLAFVCRPLLNCKGLNVKSLQRVTGVKATRETQRRGGILKFFFAIFSRARVYIGPELRGPGRM